MDPILSSILGPVCQRVIDAAIEEYRLVRDVKEEIRKLRTTVSMIKGVLEDAERKQVESHFIREWLKSLKQVIFDAEDVFDEIATDEALGTTRSAVVTKRLSKLRFILISCLRNVDHSSSSRAIAHRVKAINKKFDDISKDKDRLGLRVSDGTSWSVMGTIFRRPPPDTSSLLPKESHIIGRDGEMQKIKELLLLEYSAVGTVAATSVNYKNVHVISVVGMGGVGKTTLLQHAYNNTEVGNYFHPRMWVCVSSDFDERRVAIKIIEAASNSKKVKELRESSNGDVVQNGLRDLIEGKRFLLVLDDVWEDRELQTKWDRLYTPLSYGARGSKIIVTTRSQAVSNITKGTPIFLKDLPSDDLWTILQNYAFDGHDPDTQLAQVGREIVKKLKGSPLAAKTIGRLLNSKLDERHWKNILSSKAWVSPDCEHSILPILKLSYDHLPGHLKQSFAYCSLFPEDHEFDKGELVQLWMAQQFIIQIRGVFFHVESEGGVYLDKLVHMSLFEKYTNRYGQERFRMHDLIHNLVDSVSKDDCLRLEENQQNGTISDTVRHVSIASDRFDLPKIEQLCNKYENMRTLLFLCGCKFQLDPHLDNIFMKLKRLRVLRLSGCGIKELHASIGTLKHLRFLDLSNNYMIRKLPDSLCNLHNLQLDDETLSAWLRGLTSLRYFSIEDCPVVTSLPRAEVLSHLTALKNLEIKRLEALSSFGGGIHCLVSLEELIIRYCPELLDITTTTAADSSRPSSSSSALPSPARSVGTSSTTRIRRLKIWGSSMQQIRTWLLQCPSLQVLHIFYCPQLTGFGGNNDGGDEDVGGGDLLEDALLNLSGTLQQLDIRGCKNLRSLPPRLRCLSSLQSLRIEDCPQIRSLPVAGLPDSLRDLEIVGCHPELVEQCKEGVGSDWPLISHIPEDRRHIR